MTQSNRENFKKAIFFTCGGLDLSHGNAGWTTSITCFAIQVKQQLISFNPTDWSLGFG